MGSLRSFEDSNVIWKRIESNIASLKFLGFTFAGAPVLRILVTIKLRFLIRQQLLVLHGSMAGATLQCFPSLF